MLKKYKLAISRKYGKQDKVSGTKYYIVSDEESKAGDLTCFPTTFNGIPDWEQLEESNFIIAKWAYAQNGSYNFKVILSHEDLLSNDFDKRKVLIHEEPGRTHLISKEDINKIIQNDCKVYLEIDGNSKPIEVDGKYIFHLNRK